MPAYPHAGFLAPLYFPNQLGNPTPGKQVGLYEVGTNTLATLYSDRDRSAAAANPFTLDASGNSPPLFGEPREYDARRVIAGVPAADLVRVEIKVDDEDALGGIPDENDIGYDVVLLIGQSNMSGRGTPYDNTRLDPPDPRIWQYGNSGAYANAISLAVEPLLMHDSPSGMGPGLQFARWYAQTIPTNRRVLLVPAAHGGTGFSTNSPLNWDITDPASLAVNAVDQANAALALANADPALGATSRFVGILWHQGESDLSLTEGQYGAALDTFIAYLRANIDGAADAPFVLGQMTDLTIADPGGAGINAAHVDTPRRVLRTGFAYAKQGDAIPSNHFHFTGAGARWLGRTMFDAFRRARLNVLDTAPVAPAAIELVQTGTTLTVTWDQSFGRVTDYVAEYKPAASSTWLPLTHAEPLDVTATVTGLTLGAAYDVRVATVNEEGTSAYTAASITLDTLPVQVTGLAAGTVTVVGVVPLTWNAIGNADAYLVEYKEASSPTWLEGPTVTTPAASIYAPEFDTSFDFRVSASNGAGAGPVSSTVTVVIPAEQAPFSSAVTWLRGDGTMWADSLRTLPAFTDDTVGAWDDASGNDRHAIQATTSKRPILRAGVSGLNGIPVLGFTDDALVAPITTGATKTLFVVAKKRSPSGEASRAVVALVNAAQLYTDNDRGFGDGFIYFSPDTAVGGSPDAWNIISITWASTSSVTVRVGGGAGVTLDPDNTYSTATSMTVGAAQSLANFGDYDVAEVLMLSVTASLGEHDVVGDYLAAKYDLMWTPAA